MKILVAVKRVVDFNVTVRVKPAGSGVETIAQHNSDPAERQPVRCLCAH